MIKKVCKMNAVIENGMIKRFIIDGVAKSAYKINRKYGGYDNILPITVSAFRSGWYFERYIVM